MLATTNEPTASDPAPFRWPRRWPAIGPALLAVLLAGRAVFAEGLSPEIGLAVAGVLLGATVAAARRMRLAPLLLLVGPLAFVATPARTEMSFNLARPDDTGWFDFTLLTAAAIGLSLAAAVVIALDRPMVRRAAIPMAGIGAVGWALLVSGIDPQPDQGSDLGADQRAGLPVVTMVNYTYGTPPLELDDGRLQAHLHNDSDLPHTFTVDALDVSIYVPGGRRAVLDVAVPTGVGTLDVYCDVGDHRQLGMVYTLSIRPASTSG